MKKHRHARIDNITTIISLKNRNYQLTQKTMLTILIIKFILQLSVDDHESKERAYIISTTSVLESYPD